MVSDRCRRHDGEDFVERANAAGQCDDAVGELHHAVFPFAEVCDLDDGVAQLADFAVVLKPAGHDAGEFPSAGFDRPRGASHQPEVNAAVDEVVAIRPHPFAQLPGALEVGGLYVLTGGAKDADVFHFVTFYTA